MTLPTGTGKTIIFTQLIARRSGRALVLVNRDELVRQAVDKLTLVDPNMQVGVVKAERDEVDAHVVVASVQTVQQAQRLGRLWPDFATVVIDEAHHAPADSYNRVLTARAWCSRRRWPWLTPWPRPCASSVSPPKRCPAPRLSTSVGASSST